MTDLEARLRATAPVPAAGGDLRGRPDPAEASEGAGPWDPPGLVAAAEAAGLVDVAYACTDSPLGELLLAGTPRGLVRVCYLDAAGDDEAVLQELATRVSPRVLRAPRRLDPARRELDEFFAGARRTFQLALDLRLAGPGFARRVLGATAQIPFGEWRSYKQVAGAAGSAGAFRAAGTALGRNPLPIVIPCHRVRHSGGGIGGYTGGLERKRALLTIEDRGAGAA